MSYSFRHVLNGEWWAICPEHPHSALLPLVPRAPAGWGTPACSQHIPGKQRSSSQWPYVFLHAADPPKLWKVKSDHQDPWGRALKLLSKRKLCVPFPCSVFPPIHQAFEGPAMAPNLSGAVYIFFKYVPSSLSPLEIENCLFFSFKAKLDLNYFDFQNMSPFIILKRNTCAHTQNIHFYML